MQAPQPVAAALILRPPRVFVARRAVGQNMAGLWEFPGGKLEPGESAQACVVRELAEELGMQCEAGEVLASHVHAYEGGGIELIGVRVKLVSEAWALSVHDDAGWVGGEELLALNLAPADIPIAKTVCALLASTTTHTE